jgi:hypothetical protein
VESEAPAETVAEPETAAEPETTDVGSEAPSEEPSADQAELPEEAPSETVADPAVENSPEGSDEAAPAQEEGDAPLDLSAASDASPAAEETGAEGNATAPSDGPSGDKGDGATHDGTDTPEVMVSHPCDPITGRPLDGETGKTRQPIFGGGQAPAAVSPSGHVVPGISPESSDIEDGSDEETEDEGFEDEGFEGEGFEDEDEDEDEGYEGFGSIADVRRFALKIAQDVERLLEALDGFED